MLRRLRLPGKLVVAALPLLLTIVGVSVYLTRETLAQAAQDRDTAMLASIWDPLTATLDAIDREAGATLDAISQGGDSDLSAVRAATDERFDALETAIEAGGSPESLVRQLDVAHNAAVAVRAFHDESGTSADTQSVRIPEGYDAAKELLLEIGDLIPAEVANDVFARDLAAVSALGAARKAAEVQEQAVLDRLRDNRAFGATLEIVRAARQDLTEALASFQAAASRDWVTRYRSQEAFGAIDAVSKQIDLLIESPIQVLTKPDEEWRELFEAREAVLADLQVDLTATVSGSASDAADRGSVRAWLIIGVTLGAILVAALVTALISGSIVRRVRSLTDRARHVAQEQLPALVEALRDPSEDMALPTIPPLRDRGADEVADLARSFAAMQSTLEHVADQQLEVLRKGVADIFVTLARRNRSLIDRQLALIDQLESDEDDAELLGDLYRLDHLATRMRRNAESLLVLAGSESPRTWRRPLEIDDVVRAAIGEVEDYRRVDVLTLEPLEISGGAVADLSHLLSELIENATSFSPPDSRVRIAGHFHESGYLLTIADRGVGISEERLTELNRVLSAPPIVGLALEPTLGVYVVAMLAKRHGIKVRLVSGAPGITANILIPPSLFEVRQVREPATPRAVGELAADAGRLAPLASPSAANGNGRTSRPDVQVPPPSPAPPPLPAAPATNGNGAAPARPVQPEAGRHRTPPPLQPSATPPPPPGPAPTPTPPPPAARTAPPAAAPRAPDPLPTRVPGASYQPQGDVDRVGASSRPPDALRSALGAFQEGMRRAGEPDGPLPRRSPGSAFPDTEPAPHQATGPARDAETTRSVLSRYQIGMEVGRSESRLTEEERGDRDE